VVLVSLLLAMHIQAPGSCPSAAEVERRLVPLLPSAAAAGVPDIVVLEENVDGTLTVSLARFDNGTIAHRHLPHAPTCREQAETVAVTLAVWEALIHPELELGPVGPLVPSPPTPVAAPRAPLTAAARAAPADVVRRTVPAVDSPSSETSLGGGLVASWQPGTFVPGARADASWGRRRREARAPWRLRLSLVALGTHTRDLPPGRASWWRTYLAPGADVVLDLGASWALAAGASGVLGVMHVAGSGFAVNHSTFSIDVGGEALLRIEWRRGQLRPWLGVAAMAWLRRQRLEISGADSRPALARAEAMAMIGADFGWLR